MRASDRICGKRLRPLLPALIQEQDMRKIIETAGTVVAVIIAATFVWLVLSAP